MQNKQAFSLSRMAVFVLTLAAIGVCSLTDKAVGQGADLIWSPRHQAENVPVTDCYFRKKFTLINPEKAEIFVTADDAFELYINGQLVQRGTDSNSVFEVEVAEFLKPGVNLVALKVENFHGNSAGVAARLRVKERNETRWRSLKTDDSWKTRIDEVASWKSSGYNDIGWLSANIVKSDFLTRDNIIQPTVQANVASTQVDPSAPPAPPVRQTTPARQANIQTQPASQLPSTVKNEQPQNPVASSTSSQRQTQDSSQAQYQLDSEFRMQQLLSDEQTGSIIAIAFNEFGNLIFSKEGGPLMIANLTLPQNDPERVQVLCDHVTSCQGILPLNGDIYVTGDGPDGVALYRLGGKNLTGQLSVKTTILKFKGDLGEHGPHGLRLGPDGMIYCVIGNGSRVEYDVEKTSPFQYHYEGDLVKRYEDPGGHAAGVRGQGGTIIRTNLDGSKVETVAGGIRNAYDLVFDQWGDLFIHDSDMESDMGMTWYRPTMVSHVVDGADMGWRSGWAKFPEYFADTVPAAARTGRGSPTGAVCYQHLQFPSRYHNAMFFADWSEGRILAAVPQQKGSTTTFKTEVFLSGKPLNVTDLVVGEDGAIYFSTGGRGTSGGLYRIFWGGDVPESLFNFENDLARVIRHPQPDSAWARQNIAKLQNKLVTTWKADIQGIAKETRNKPAFRTRALDIMVVYGPFPTLELLNELSKDQDAQVRAKVASICGLKTGFQSTLESMINDSSPRVRRRVCEAYLRLGEEPNAADLLTILRSTDRFETVAARRLLQRIPASQWIEDVLSTDDKRIFINGSLAVLAAQPTLERSYEILARTSELMDEFVTDADFVDMLRVIQVALIQGKVDPQSVPAFADRIQREFPSASGILNRELSRILAYLKAGELDGRIAEYFKTTTDSNEDKVHVAMFLQTIGKQLSDSARIAVINQLEEAKSYGGGGSYKLYLTKAIREVSETMTASQVPTFLENGDRWPTAVISAFYRMPTSLDADQIQSVIELDKRLQERADDVATKQARMGVIAVLAQSGEEPAMEYLRTMWQAESDRRADIAIGLAQQPGGKNWPYLVSSLPVLDDMTSVEVLTKLTQVDLRPKTASFYQQVLKLGYRLENDGAIRAAQLLEHWSGESPDVVTGSWKATLNYWKRWYETKYPEGPAIEIPNAQKVGRYSVSQVSSYMNDPQTKGDAERGHLLFTKAQCANCHRFGAFGDSTGPDLTSIASRFSRREIIEAVVNPSKVISDQYKSQTVLTEDGQQFSGMLVRESAGYTVLQSDGNKVQIADSDVNEIKEDSTSSMPEGLLDNLDESEIRDLFAYIYSSNPDRFASEKEAIR
jgi:putative heme-binding domain-containing protein